MINRFYLQNYSNLTTEYDAGNVAMVNEEFIVTSAMKGAEDTFSVGQPVYDKDHNLMGYLGIGLYDSLNYSADIRIPVEYWRICLPTKHCKEGKKVFTYWQEQESKQ